MSNLEGFHSNSTQEETTTSYAVEDFSETISKSSQTKELSPLELADRAPMDSLIRLEQLAKSREEKIRSLSEKAVFNVDVEKDHQSSQQDKDAPPIINIHLTNNSAKDASRANTGSPQKTLIVQKNSSPIKQSKKDNILIKTAKNIKSKFDNIVVKNHMPKNNSESDNSYIKLAPEIPFSPEHVDSQTAREIGPEKQSATSNLQGQFWESQPAVHIGNVIQAQDRSSKKGSQTKTNQGDKINTSTVLKSATPQQITAMKLGFLLGLTFLVIAFFTA